MVALEDAEASTRNLVFEHDGELAEEYPYFHSGTCFVASYLEHGFVLTARHALNFGREQRGETLRVFAAHDKSGDSIPFDKLIQVNAREGVPDDIADVEVLHVASHLLSPAQAAFVKRIDLAALRPQTRQCWHKPGARFVIPGFPTDKKEIDYDKFVIREQRVIHGARLTEDLAERRIHMVAMDDPAAHKSLDGMSGSPVFSVARFGGQLVCPTFDGILIRGSRVGTAAGAFICAAIIFGVLDQAVNGGADDPS